MSIWLKFYETKEDAALLRNARDVQVPYGFDWPRIYQLIERDHRVFYLLHDEWLNGRRYRWFYVRDT